MKYFTPNFIQFFQELPANNNTEWFKANKNRYEEFVKQPFELFITDLIQTIKPLIPHLDITAKEAIFRINRDIRFSKDKTPYKIHTSAAISRGGKKDYTNPGLYLQLAAEDIRIYSGMYELTTPQLEKVRKKIASETDRFLSLINEKEFKNSFGTIHGEKYKRVPKGYEKIAEKTDLILNKQFYYYQVLKPETILEDNVIETIIDKYKPALKLNEFFREALMDG